MADQPGERPVATLTVTRDELREAIREVFYPRIPAADEVGQARVDRAVGRVIDALGLGVES